MNYRPTVFIVDDDLQVREFLRATVESAQLAVESFDTAEDFINSLDASRPGCVMVDVKLSGMNGLELQERLKERSINLPVIMMSGYGDIRMAVRAMKKGAISFIEKPVSAETVLDSVREAIAKDEKRREEEKVIEQVTQRLLRLTPRELEVMELVVAGNANKEVAAKLQLSEKTIEIHRAHVMKKMQAESVAELVRLAILYKSTKGKS